MFIIWKGGSRGCGEPARRRQIRSCSFSRKAEPRGDPAHQIKQVLRTLSYLKNSYKDDTEFDGELKAALIAYQTHHLLDKRDGSLNAEVYAQMGTEMTNTVLETMTQEGHPGLEWLLYDTRLAVLGETWDNVPAFIPEKDFVGWGHADCNEDCYDYRLWVLVTPGRPSGRRPAWIA